MGSCPQPEGILAGVSRAPPRVFGKVIIRAGSRGSWAEIGEQSIIREEWRFSSRSTVAAGNPPSFQFTSKRLRDFIDPNHLLIQIAEQLGFAQVVVPLDGRYVNGAATRFITHGCCSPPPEPFIASEIDFGSSIARRTRESRLQRFARSQ